LPPRRASSGDTLAAAVTLHIAQSRKVRLIRLYFLMGIASRLGSLAPQCIRLGRLRAAVAPAHCSPQQHQRNYRCCCARRPLPPALLGLPFDGNIAALLR